MVIQKFVQAGRKVNVSMKHWRFVISSITCPLATVTLLRTVPTFVTAHTFCASRDSRVSYGWCLLIQGYFLRGLKLCGESRT